MSDADGLGRPSPVARFLRRPETLGVLALTLALAVVYLAARDAGPFRALEGGLLDLRFRIRGPQAHGREVSIVAVDDRTLAELGHWPFSRAWLARAVDAIAADGARCIAFDLLLIGAETRGAVPARRGAGAPGDGAALGTVAEGPDKALAEAIARAGSVVVPFAFVFETAEANVSDLPEAIAGAAYRLVRSDPRRPAELPAHPAGVLAPLASYLAAGRPAHVTVFLEADGSLRFTHPVIRYGGSYYPSLPVEAARLFLGVDPSRVTLDLGLGLALGERFFATDRGMALAINYLGPRGSFETRSLIDVATGNFAAGTFRDRVVLIGATAAGLSERFVTPYSPKLSGVEVFANVIDNLLEQRFLLRSPLTVRLDLLAVALGGLLAALLGVLRRPAVALLATVVLIGLWGAVNLYSFVALQAWLNLTFPGLAIVLGAGIVAAGRGLRETRLRRRAEAQRETLSRYVSPLTAAGLRARDASGRSERSQMAAVMFVDLVGFTRASEKLTPAETAQLLRRFHDCVERAAQANRGVIDKFIGDAALVVFGVPAAGPSDAANAVVCARTIAAELSDWDAELRAAGSPGVACSAGIHFGPVTIAEVGGSVHAQITVTGDAVNVASRLEALTRGLGVTIVVSDAAMEAARAAGMPEAVEGFEGQPVQPIRGRERPIGIWAWPAPSGE